MHSRFPRYNEFDPRVPVWCVTPERTGCMHRFFDTSPISPSGRYLAVLQFPQEQRRPAPGEQAQVVLVDLERDEDRVVATTHGWEGQMGANINWGGSDEELFFNDVDTASWTPFAWRLNVSTGEKVRLAGTVYHASPDGRWLVSANTATMRRTQPGYGVMIPEERMRWNVGLADDDGFYLTDAQSGACRLFASIRELMTQADPPVWFDPDERIEVYGFHSKFSPRGDMLMLSLRWFPAADTPRWDLFTHDCDAVRFAWIVVSLDKSVMHCAVGPEQWEKGGHHATWFPDSTHISMNLAIDRGCMRLVQVRPDGSRLRTMRDDIIGSGHPTVSPDGTHVLTDTYTCEPSAFGDGTIPLRWIDLRTGAEQTLVRINTAQPSPHPDMRVDPHPAWDRSGRYVTFNGFVGGTRRVFVADMSSLVSR
ncbi:MAG: hypothetical protein GF331_22490 [Chitinivibrionales bacterium]|nr:hypothetical protein [Chitinivibrionales bacterium]